MTKEIQEILQGSQYPMRLAKAIARAGICSRREAETLIEKGKVTVNGSITKTPAHNVEESDVVTVNDKELPPIESVRLWLYHKPSGLVNSNKDDQGRKTIFDSLPDNMPRVISIGRLDLNSEGLLLLTNDGEFARSLELPSSGWERVYRVRVHGTVNKKRLESLQNGVVVDGVKYGKIIAELESEQTASNTWLRITLTEGKNREIRRVMAHLGYEVSRLIRISYGAFSMTGLSRGQVREVTQGQIKLKALGQKPKKSWAKAKPKNTTKPGHKARAKVQRLKRLGLEYGRDRFHGKKPDIKKHTPKNNTSTNTAPSSDNKDS